MNWLLATLAYVVPTFPLGYLWHLTWMRERYRTLGVYRERVLPLLGLSSMIIQGLAFGWIYVTTIAPMPGGWLVHAATYFLVGGVTSWSFTTLASAAKNQMTSVRDYLAIESGFTAIQWAIVAAITATLVQG